LPVKFTMRVKAPAGVMTSQVKAECARVDMACRLAKSGPAAKTWRDYVRQHDAVFDLFWGSRALSRRSDADLEKICGWKVPPDDAHNVSRVIQHYARKELAKRRARA
jgi:hypothetical protein